MFIIETRDWNQQILSYETFEKKIPVHFILIINESTWINLEKYYLIILHVTFNYVNTNSVKMIRTNIVHT